MKQYDQSILLFEETLKLERAKFGPDNPETLETQAQLGVVYREAGRVADAIPLLDDAHQKGRKHPELAWVGNALLTAYVQAGKKAEATALVAAQVGAARKRFPADSLPLAAALADVGKALLDAKAYADAEPLLLAGYEGIKKHAAQVSPRNRRDLTNALERLVQLYDARGMPEEAAKWRKELETLTKAAGPAVKPKDK
jgi:tetratricopeptide (TPR) repeat protein